jgi:hypothetical protein
MREIAPKQQILSDLSALREEQKQHTEYTNFLFDLSEWPERLKNGDWAPWRKPNGESENYKKYCARLDEFVSLQLNVPRNHFFIGDGKLVGVVRELQNLSDDLARRACKLIREDKRYLFNPLVQATIFFHLHKQDFMNDLSEAIKRKPKAAKHGNKKSTLVWAAAFLLSVAPGAKPSDIYRELAKMLDREPVFRLLLGDKDLHLESFRKFFKRNKAEIFWFRDHFTALRDLLTTKPT